MILPNDPPNVVPGSPRLVWFSTLKYSARNISDSPLGEWGIARGADVPIRVARAHEEPFTTFPKCCRRG